MIRALILLACLLPWNAWAIQTTPCPTVSNYINILQVFIINTPAPLVNAQYDIDTSYLWVLLANGATYFFIQVPLSQAQGTPQWATISSHHEALMQQGSICPILTSNNTPLLTR